MSLILQFLEKDRKKTERRVARYLLSLKTLEFCAKCGIWHRDYSKTFSNPFECLPSSERVPCPYTLLLEELTLPRIYFREYVKPMETI